MSFSPDPMQRLLLWRLAVGDDGGAFLKEIEANFTPAKRAPLLREGLVAEDRRKHPHSGRSAIYLELTDKGWAWCQNHMDEELTSRSLLSTPILERLLKLLKNYLQHQDGTPSLGQFILQARPRRTSSPALAGDNDAAVENGRAAELPHAIRRMCLELAGGQENVRVRLADLRLRLVEVPRPALDAALLEMQQSGELSLYRLDNPQEIRAEDRDAVLRTATGQERHIIYFGGHAS